MPVEWQQEAMSHILEKSIFREVWKCIQWKWIVKETLEKKMLKLKNLSVKPERNRK